MDYEEIERIKENGESMVQLIKEKAAGDYFIRKVMKGQHSVYLTLKNCQHPFLPKVYEVTITDDTTTIIEEYIEGRTLGYVKLSKKQFLQVVKDLCSVLEFLHGMSIIHRDIKPSNIIYAQDGHIRLIDFDSARVLKDNQDKEQDTRLMGTRGYAPPEQYGFSQTDVRTDIYSLGVTLKQIEQDRIQKLRYKRIIQKCMDLNPDKRYQTIRQVKKAFFHRERYVLYGMAVLLPAVFLGSYMQKSRVAEPQIAASERYPNQILWEDLPVREYLGRYIDDVMEEMDAPCDENNNEAEENICSYREMGIVFWFNEERKVDLIAIDPALSTFNGEMLNVNRDKLIQIMGDPVFAGWTQRQQEGVKEVYCLDYYELDTKEGITFYLPSPGEEANIIYID